MIIAIVESPKYSFWPVTFSVIYVIYNIYYISDLPADLGDSAFLFADDVKMAFERPQSSLEGMEPTDQPQRVLLSHSWKPPFHFSVFLHGRRQPPNSTGHHRPRPAGSVVMTLTSSVHCREAANTARQLFFTIRRSLCELSKAAFIPLYCAIVRPHLEYAMEANARHWGLILTNWRWSNALQHG